MGGPHLPHSWGREGSKNTSMDPEIRTHSLKMTPEGLKIKLEALTNMFPLLHATQNPPLDLETRSLIYDIGPWSEDCFYYCSERNNVVVLFGTLKVQSFLLTEVSDCGLLIVVTSSTFLKRNDMLKEKSS